MMTSCAAVTELWARGYNALPYPRRIELGGGETHVDANWTLAPVGEIDSAAMDSLVAGLTEAFGQRPSAIGEPGAHCITLAVNSGTVATPPRASRARDTVWKCQRTSSPSPATPLRGCSTGSRRCCNSCAAPPAATACNSPSAPSRTGPTANFA